MPLRARCPRRTETLRRTYVDLGDVKTECTEVSIEGNTFIEGNRGGGKLAIGFDKIRTVDYSG